MKAKRSAGEPPHKAPAPETEEAAPESSRADRALAGRFGADKDLPMDALIQCRTLIDEIIAGLDQLRSRLGNQTDMAESAAA